MPATTSVSFATSTSSSGPTQKSLPLIDRPDADEILAATGYVLGPAGVLRVRKGEISVLMGLSGSGKSTLLRA